MANPTKRTKVPALPKVRKVSVRSVAPNVGRQDDEKAEGALGSGASQSQDDLKLRLRAASGVKDTSKKDALGAVGRLLSVMQKQASQAGKHKRRGGEGMQVKKPTGPLSQRCMVKATYSSRRAGWAAHAEYLQREGAKDELAREALPGEGPGFNAKAEGLDLKEMAKEWASSGDKRMFKFIISPEFGKRVDLRALTRHVVAQMERDLDMDLEWGAVVHDNTNHPHVHLMLRGRNMTTGADLQIAGPYLSGGVRNIAQAWLTKELGHRTEQDVVMSREQEITAQRWTSLDQELEKLQAKRGHLLLQTRSKEPAVLQRLGQLRRRVRFLMDAGLAEPAQRRGGPADAMFLLPEARGALRAREQAANRAAQVAKAKAFITDTNAPLMADSFATRKLDAGKVLDFGLDEASGQLFIFVESVDGSLRYLTQPHKLAVVEPLRQGQTYLFEVKEDGRKADRVFYALHQTRFADPLDTKLVDKWLQANDLQPPPFMPGDTYAARFSQAAQARSAVLRREQGLAPVQPQVATPEQEANFERALLGKKASAKDRKAAPRELGPRQLSLLTGRLDGKSPESKAIEDKKVRALQALAREPGRGR